MRLLYSSLALGLMLTASAASAQITVANPGNWSDPTTWSTGAVPTATDDVVLDSTVTIDISDAVVRNVTIRGAGDASGLLRPNRGLPEGGGAGAAGITIFGDLLLEEDGGFYPLSNQSEDGTVQYGEIYHRLTVHGDITNNGGSFDMRRGATSTTPASAAFVDLVFAGDEDATMTLGAYDNNDNQLFRTEVAKTNGATISLGSDATIDNNSRATFKLTSGYMDTGDFRFTLISNNSTVVEGGSPASYVIGELARGLPKGTVDSQTSRYYPVGDEDGFRPATVYVTDRSSDDQFFGVRVISGDADTGSSTFGAPLMDVSPERYYAFEWYFFDSSDPITIDNIEISYGGDDQVPEGSTDFVVATSTDDRMTWVSSDGNDPDDSDHTTTLANPPTPIKTAMLDGWTFDFEVQGSDIVNDVYYAAIGTTGMFGTSIVDGPGAAALDLTAFPNPTVGSADLSFTLARAGDVTVEVFDVLGRRVATLADGPMGAGDQELTWTPNGLPSGMYLVRLQVDGVAASRAITLTR